MTQQEANNLLLAFHVLGLATGALISDETARETCWFHLEQACRQPIREFLATIDPNEDPSVLLQAVQALHAIREDGIWIRRIQQNQELPQDARWQ